MDIALQIYRKPKQLGSINSCRRYLQAISIADITNIQGNKILIDSKSGATSPNHYRHRGMKFNQPNPPASSWYTWRKFLKRAFEDDRGFLRQPLRNYVKTHDHCRIHPPHIYDPTTADLYYKSNTNSDYFTYTKDPILGYTTPDNPVPRTPQGFPVRVMDYGNKVIPLRNFTPPTPISLDPHITFQSSINTLPLWERELLTNVILLDTPIHIVEQLNSGPFHIGSDGSVIANSASFGYVFSSHSKQRLLRGRGPAPGSRPQSFRAEAYGALAARRMLIHLAKYTGTPLRSPFNHYIDNKSVISRQRKAKQQKYPIPNHTLAPDWDVISMLTSSNNELPPNETHWVKGHQDLEKDYDLLSLPAQLNCDADFEAGQFQQHNAANRPNAPMLPNTHAQLMISGESIHSHYKSRIREAATVPNYFNYLEGKFDWSTATRTTIDWGAYKQIIRQFHNRQVTLVKHLHEMAPSGHISHRNNHHYPQSCPSCTCDDETNNHILCCPADSRKEWRSKLLRQISISMPSTTNDPHLADILRDGLTRWFRHLPDITADQYPTQYHNLITTQNNIGWSHLFRGRWSIEWQLQHKEYALRTNLEGKEADSSRWLRKIGRIILTSWFELWTLRNLERHGKDEAEQKAKRAAFLHSQLSELYDLQTKMIPSHRVMFSADLQTHILQKPNLDGIENWIHTFGPAIHSSIKQAIAQSAAAEGRFVHEPRWGSTYRT
jgi:hypothetical protein